MHSVEYQICHSVFNKQYEAYRKNEQSLEVALDQVRQASVYAAKGPTPNQMRKLRRLQNLIIARRAAMEAASDIAMELGEDE